MKGVQFGSKAGKKKLAPTLTLPRGEGRRGTCKMKTRRKQDKTRRTPRAWCVSTNSERKRTGLPVQPWRQTPNQPQCPQGHRKQPLFSLSFAYFSFSFLPQKKRKKSKRKLSTKKQYTQIIEPKEQKINVTEYVLSYIQCNQNKERTNQ